MATRHSHRAGMVSGQPQVNQIQTPDNTETKARPHATRANTRSQATTQVATANTKTANTKAAKAKTKATGKPQQNTSVEVKKATSKPPKLPKNILQKNNAPQPTRTRTNPHAVEIDVNAESSDNELAPTLPVPKKPSKITAKQALEAREDEEEEADSDSDGDEEMNPEAERDDDMAAGDNLHLEAPVLMDMGLDDEEITVVSTRSSSPYSAPPDTDEAFSEAAEEEVDQLEDEDDPKPAVPKVKTVTGQKRKQLDYELPHVSSEDLPKSKKAKKKATMVPTTAPGHTTLPVANAPSSSTASDSSWLPHTNIVTKKESSTNHTMSMNNQPSFIRKVLKRGIYLGKLMMLTEDEYCPVSSEQMKDLALASMIRAAEEKGLTGQWDVADRLECGDELTYIRPICVYNAGVIGTDRKKQLKIPAVAVVLQAYGLGPGSTKGVSFTQDLVQSGRYLYGINEAGDFMNTKPFMHPVFEAYIKTVYFGSSEGYAGIISANHPSIFTSSVPGKPLELEIPMGMMALSAVTIHAILTEYSLPAKQSFPSPASPAAWKSAMLVLTNLRTKHLPIYHKITYELYMKTSGAAPLAKHGKSTDQIYAGIDWAGIAAMHAEDDEPTDPLVAKAVASTAPVGTPIATSSQPAPA